MIESAGVGIVTWVPQEADLYLGKRRPLDMDTPSPAPMTPNSGVGGADSLGGERESRSRHWHKQWQKGGSA